MKYKDAKENGAKWPRSGQLVSMRTLGDFAYRLPIEVPIELKRVLMLLPSRPNDVIKTTAIRAAIKPYSIAVAPDSPLRNFCRNFFTGLFLLTCAG